MTPAESETLYRAKFGSVCRFVRGLGAGRELAEEVAQDAFARILSLPNLAGREIGVSYWFRAAHTLLMRTRRHRTERLPDAELLPEPTSDKPSVEPDEPVPSFEMLSAREFAAVRMSCSGMTYEHIAVATGETKSNVTNLRHRGVEKLRLTNRRPDGMVVLSADR